jgi:LIVCS family branched-chain amino acid:cation transporter
MSHYKVAFTAGLAMFAMFFGSGNLVFPLIIGMQSTDQYLTASIGLMLTGVVVPFAGLFSMILYQGHKDKYFGLLGKYAPFTISLLILSLIGPFGVVPRCILVSYGGISLVYPQIQLPYFSAFFLTLALFIIWKKDKIVPIIGKILGPLKIGGLILIILAAVWQSPSLIAAPQIEPPFKLGLIQGYQTMDLMAAFFFSVAIVEYLRKVCKDKEETMKVSLLASFIGAVCIAMVYLGLVALGAHYAADLANVNKEQYLATIAKLTLGDNAAWIVALTIFLSCLATGATLVRLFAEFLRDDLTKKKLSWHLSIFVTIAISFAFSLTGFDAILVFLHHILTYAYPALITLAITSILHHFYGFKWIKQIFWLAVLASVITS